MATDRIKMSAFDNQILLVDDEPDILEILSDIFTNAGYECTKAANGEEAIDLVQRQDFAAVVTDIKMPGKTGIDVLQAVKAKNSDTVVILLTGYGALNTAVEALKLGAQDYLSKPFDVNNVLQVIQRCLEHRQLVLENHALHAQTRRDRDELAKRVVELEILRELGVNFSFTFNYERLFHMIFNSLTRCMHYDVSAILDLAKRRMTLRPHVRMSDDDVEALKKSMLGTLADSAGITTPATDAITVELTDAGEERDSDQPLTHGFNVLLTGDETPFGVLNVSRRGEKPFSALDIQFVTDLAEQTAAVFRRLKSVLAAHREQLQRIIDALPDGLLMLDPEKDTLLANPTARELLALAHDQSPSFEDIEHLLGIRRDEIMHALHESDAPLLHECTIRHGEQDTRQLSAHIALLPSVDHAAQGIVMLLRDVTQQRRLESMQRQWLGNVSQELREPTTVIREFVALLHKELEPVVTDALDAYLEVTEANVERLSHLIHNLLHASLEDQEDLPIHIEELDAVALVRRELKILEPQLTRQDISLQSKLPGVKVPLEADPDAVSQILTNLVDNARKFSPAGSTVIVELTTSGDRVIITVTDQGFGIPIAYQDKIYDRFFRLIPPELQQIEGSGLGLTVVKALVERHGGTITIESRPREGTTVRVALPLQAVAGLREGRATSHSPVE